MVDLDLIYNVSLHKLHNFQTTRSESDGLRKLVLLNNFVFKKFVSPEQEEPLEWSEEDIKKDEENWLDSCLDGLDEDEDEDGYVYINKPLDTVAPFPIDCYDDPRHYEDYYVQDNNKEHSQKQQFSKADNVIIPHDLLHLPFFAPFHMAIEGEQDNNSNIRNTFKQDDDVNMTEVESYSENLTCEKGFHPYWKDNSIIDHSTSSLTKSSPFRPHFDLNTRSFGIPKIFHKYRRRIAPPFDSSAILELLQPDYLYQSLEFPYYESSLKRSKDDLDILYSLTPRDLDQGVLMDMISMLEYYGGKTNHNNEKKLNSSEINDIWFVDNNNT